MANVGFITKTYTAADWGVPNPLGEGRLYLNQIETPGKYTYPSSEDAIVFPHNIATDGVSVGVQSCAVALTDRSNRKVQILGWGVEYTEVVDNTLIIRPFLWLLPAGTPELEISNLASTLTLSIVVQYAV